MPDRHPDAETLTRYLSGQSAEDERDRVERHVAGCAACRRRLKSTAGEGSDAGYGAAVRRATARAGERLPDLLREIEAGTARLAELLGLRPDEREPALADPRFHLLKLADLLEEAARLATFLTRARRNPELRFDAEG